MSLLPADVAWRVISRSIKKPLGSEIINLDSVYRQPVGKELLSLSGRVLARDVFSPISVPTFNNSAMDGYALSRRQWVKNRQKIFSVYPEIVFAGCFPPQKILSDNYIWRVMTGAPLPAGCDLVIPQEYGKELAGGQVKLSGKFQKYANVRFVGEDIKRGQKLISAGTEINPLTIALLTAAGVKKITVYRQPRVFIITTGKEVILPGQKISPGQIYNINAYTLALLADKWGAIPSGFCHSDDELLALKKNIRLAMSKSDIALVSAGVSVGKYDFVRRALEESGAKILFHRLAIKPARPLLMAKKGEKIIFGVPGNPASTIVAFRLFVLPAIRLLTGQKPEFTRRETGFITTDFHKLPDRRNFVRAKKIIKNGKVFLKPIGPHGSNIIHSLASADCLIDIPKLVKHLPKGQLVRYFLL